jgi:hypothetical protein
MSERRRNRQDAKDAKDAKDHAKRIEVWDV